MERASDLVRGWAKAGRVELIGRAERKRLKYRVATSGVASLAEGRTQTSWGNMWRAMRGLTSFTPLDIATHATTDAVSVSREEAAVYCQMLVRAGYLRVLRKALPGRREASYRLIRNTGPMPPRERRVRAVYDDNLQEYTHLAGGAP